MRTEKGMIQVNGAEPDRGRSAAMAPTDQATMTRVVSRDGTQIAYWTSGEGPPLVLVHGTTADHTRWGPLLPYLEPHATVHAIDRRAAAPAATGRITSWPASSRMSPPWSTRSGRPPGRRSTCSATRMAGSVRSARRR